MEGMIAVVLNAVVVALLIAAIGFGMRLQRRLAALQSAHSELAQLLGRLDGALAQASTTVSALKYGAARQLESTVLREPQIAEPARQAAPVATIRTAPTHVEAAKPAAQRRRKPATLADTGRADTGRAAAASELMAVMKNLRNAG